MRKLPCSGIGYKILSVFTQCISVKPQKTGTAITSNLATKLLFCFGIGTPDELAGQVQKELDILNQMDTSIMEQLSTDEPEMSEDIACTCVVPSPVLSQILNKALREGISVSIRSVSQAESMIFCTEMYASWL